MTEPIQPDTLLLATVTDKRSAIAMIRAVKLRRHAAGQVVHQAVRVPQKVWNILFTESEEDPPPALYNDARHVFIEGVYLHPVWDDDDD